MRLCRTRNGPGKDAIVGIYRKAFGGAGEDEAERVLRKDGYAIVLRNYRCRHGEIDIIAKDGDTIVFVEVKTRRGDSFGTPKCGVDSRKKRHIVRSAQAYLQENGIVDCLVRFDVVSIERTGGAYVCEVVKDAFGEDS